MAQKKGILLIVEDEPVLRQVLLEILSPLADEIRTAEDGQVGLAAVKSGEVDAIIADISMPVMNGLQFLAEVRSLALQTPFVILTAYGDKENIVEALRLNAVDFIEKPCKPEEVRNVIAKALNYGLALRELEEQINELYKNSTLPPEKIAHIKKIKKLTSGIKLGMDMYKKAS